ERLDRAVRRLVELARRLAVPGQDPPPACRERIALVEPADVADLPRVEARRDAHRISRTARCDAMKRPPTRSVSAIATMATVELQCSATAPNTTGPTGISHM